MNAALVREAEILGRRIAQSEMEKTGSLADAILGAPVAAIAARISAPEGSKAKATAYGLLIGALMGWSAGQQSLSRHIEGKPKIKRKSILSTSPKELMEKSPTQMLEEHPLLAMLMAGVATGKVGKLLPKKS